MRIGFIRARTGFNDVNEPSGYIKGDDFINQTRDCQLLKKERF
jgi:hypothetical protein